MNPFDFKQLWLLPHSLQYFLWQLDVILELDHRLTLHMRQLYFMFRTFKNVFVMEMSKLRDLCIHIKVTYNQYVWTDARSGKSWWSWQLRNHVSVDITSLVKGLTLWPAFDRTEFKLWWGRMLNLICSALSEGGFDDIKLKALSLFSAGVVQVS